MSSDTERIGCFECHQWKGLWLCKIPHALLWTCRGERAVFSWDAGTWRNHESVTTC